MNVGLGVATLALRTVADGVVRGCIEAPGTARFLLEGRIVTDEDGEVSVEGTVAPAAARSDFTLYREDDGSFGLLITPYDATGTPRLVGAVILAMRRWSTRKILPMFL